MMSLQVSRAQSCGSLFADSCLCKEDLGEILWNSAEAKSLARSLEEGLLSRLAWTLPNLLLWKVSSSSQWGGISRYSFGSLMHHTLSSWITQNNYVYCLTFKLLTFKSILESIVDMNRTITMDYNEEEPILVACHQHRTGFVCSHTCTLSPREKEMKMSKVAASSQDPGKSLYNIWHHLIMEPRPQWLYNDTWQWSWNVHYNFTSVMFPLRLYKTKWAHNSSL